jgi:hypothetical protein
VRFTFVEKKDNPSNVGPHGSLKRICGYHVAQTGRQPMELTASWKMLATILAFGFLTAMILGMI